MKRKFISLWTVFLSFVFFLGLFSCQKPDDEVKPVVIFPAQSGETLLSVMEDMQEAGELTFVVANGMITEINGVKNALSYDPCWMLYTGDEAFSNTEWGSYEYEGEVLGSATLGAESLVVKAGEVYVWVYQAF